VKQQFSKISLGFGGLELRVGASVGGPRLRKIGIVRRHYQLLDASDLLIDELTQLSGAVPLGRGDATACQEHGENAAGPFQGCDEANRLLYRGAALSIPAHCIRPFHFVHHRAASNHWRGASEYARETHSAEVAVRPIGCPLRQPVTERH
jgi:hypothetical protein